MLGAASVLIPTAVSHYNYPGGEALVALNRRLLLEPRGATVHMDVAACMTGVTRFGELRRPDVQYSKDEDLLSLDAFDWLLTARPR